jgi:transcription elongation factor Elf1
MYFVAGKMRKFEIRLYNLFEKKFILLFFCFLIFLIGNCANIVPPVPLREGYSAPGEEVIPSLLVSGNIISNRDSVGVQKYDESSWISLQFKGEIDTTSIGIKVVDINGNRIPFIREWDTSKDKTKLILKPLDRLSYNTGYILKTSGTEIYKLNGEYFDLNGDKIVGEVIDDDFVFPFVTVKTDNSKGDWSFVSEDKIPPFVTPMVFFLAGEKPTPYVWTDANIALYIYDYTWELADTSIIVVAVDSATVKNNNFEIAEKDSKEKIPLKSVTYVSSPEAPDFGRVIIDPFSELKPDRWYFLRVRGGVSDIYGNKLGRDDSVVFEKKFKTFFCNHDSSECVKDTTAPVVLNWRNLGPSFEVEFSELIDAASVTDSAVYLSEARGELFVRNDCGQTFVRFTTSKRISVSGHTAFVTEAVKDLAGNKVKEVVSNYFEKRID